jgi:hypothetical protein
MKILTALFGTIAFLTILVLAWWIAVNQLAVNVVFYSALYAVAAALVLYSAVLWATPWLNRLNSFEKLQHFITCLLLGYILAISIPTVIDRSLSFYILEKLQQRGGGIQLSKFEQIFTGEYMREHRLVDIRLTEQSESGTIRIEGDCVRLTEKGRHLASFSRFFRQHWLPKERLLRGEYTDALIDPFKRSDQAPNYLCN